jgi:hypothetical protein
MIDSTRDQDSTQARTRTASEPLCDSVTALAASRLGDGIPGAPPSNTAPANCIDDQNLIYRADVDSLYLSFVGTLSQEAENQIIELKSLAQSDNPHDVAKAVLEIERHRFEVFGSGTRNFPYILKDGVFNIQLSKASSDKLPMAYVQIASETLTLSGLIPTVLELKGILRQLGSFTEIKVSRVDICCDFSTPVDFVDLPLAEWISRSKKRHNYFESGVFSGYVFGQGSPMSARLYDKTLEIKKSKKDYMKDIWWGEGWDRKCQVWRLEFQIKRSVLIELGISSFDDLLGTLNTLWEYATQNWLRLILPGKDQTKARWPNHPLWADLQKADLGRGNQALLKRSHITGIPGERQRFINGLSGITLHMAIENIETFKEAGPSYLEAAADFHGWNSMFTGEDIEAHCYRQAALKARKYNTKFGVDKVDSADDYRKAKGRI